MRKNVHGIFAFTIRKSGFKSIEFSTGHLKTRCCFHHHTPPRIDIPPTNAAIPGICRRIRNQQAKSQIKRSYSLILAEFNHQVKYPFSGGAAPGCYCWPRSLYQSPTILGRNFGDDFPTQSQSASPKSDMSSSSSWDSPYTVAATRSKPRATGRQGQQRHHLQQKPGGYGWEQKKMVDGWRNCQESLLYVYFTPDCFFGLCLKDQVMYEWLSGVGGIEAPQFQFSG